MVRAGDLRQRITIKRLNRTQSPTTGEMLAGTPSVLAANLPAKVEAVSGGELVRGRQVSAEATTLFTVRYRADVTTQMIVTYESRTLNIVRAQDPYGDRRELRIECREKL